jgi:polyphosphate kinase 2
MGTGSDQQKLEDLVYDEMIDGLDEEIELEIGDELMARLPGGALELPVGTPPPLDRKIYFSELLRLQRELVKLQEWVVDKGLKVVVLFEGRDAAGKGGVIKRVMQRLNPRICRTVALSAPTERERSQWYFQRYIAHLPAAGEIVLFDRSWYNRAGVERVMGFCKEDDVEEFFRTVPEFERMLVRSGIVLLKYWFSITDEQQNLRFLMRIHDPLKQWKLSPMDLESRRRWEDYTRAKEEMLARTHIPEARWWVIEGNDKKRARLNCIHHLLQQVPYRDVAQDPIVLPPRDFKPDYMRKPVPPELHVPSVY